jgi:hypothetical protein
VVLSDVPETSCANASLPPTDVPISKKYDVALGSGDHAKS